jgi:hypothetical protein
VVNARKQQRKNQLNDKEDSDLAALAPLSHNNNIKNTTLIEPGNQTLNQKNANSNNNSQSDMNGAITNGNTERLSISSLNQEPTKEYSKYKKCKRCDELHTDKLQLQEALEKTNLFTYASDMKKSTEKKIIEFEISVPTDELIEQIDSISNHFSSDSIWIIGRLDVSTGRATYSRCGKIREYQKLSNQISKTDMMMTHQ